MYCVLALLFFSLIFGLHFVLCQPGPNSSCLIGWYSFSISHRIYALYSIILKEDNSNIINF